MNSPHLGPVLWLLRRLKSCARPRRSSWNVWLLVVMTRASQDRWVGRRAGGFPRLGRSQQSLPTGTSLDPPSLQQFGFKSWLHSALYVLESFGLSTLHKRSAGLGWVRLQDRTAGDPVWTTPSLIQSSNWISSDFKVFVDCMGLPPAAWSHPWAYEDLTESWHTWRRKAKGPLATQRIEIADR